MRNYFVSEFLKKQKLIYGFGETLAKGKRIRTEVVAEVCQTLILFNLNLIISKRIHFQNRLINYNHNWLPKKFIAALNDFIEKADKGQIEFSFFKERGKNKEEKERCWLAWERNREIFDNLIDGNDSGKGQSLKYALNPFYGTSEELNEYLPSSEWLEQLCSKIWTEKNGIEAAVKRMRDLKEQIDIHYKELKIVTNKHQLRTNNYPDYANKFKELSRLLTHLHYELILFENYSIYFNTEKRGEIAKQYEEIFYPVDFKERLTVLVIDDTTGGHILINGEKTNPLREAFCQKLGLEDKTGDLSLDVPYKATVPVANAVFLSGQEDPKFVNGKKTCRNKTARQVVDEIIASDKENGFSLILLDLIFEEIEDDKTINQPVLPFGFDIQDEIHKRQAEVGIPGIVLSQAAQQTYKQQTESSIFKSYESRIGFTKKKLIENLLKYGLQKPENLIALQQNVSRAMAYSSLKLHFNRSPKDIILEKVEKDENLFLIILYFVRRYEQIHNAKSTNRFISENVFRAITEQIRDGEINSNKLQQLIEDMIEEFEEKEELSIAHIGSHPNWKLRDDSLGVEKGKRKKTKEFSEALIDLQKRFEFEYFKNHTPADVEKTYQHLIQTTYHFVLQLLKVCISNSDNDATKVFNYFFNENYNAIGNLPKQLYNLTRLPILFPGTEKTTPELYEKLEEIILETLAKRRNIKIKKFLDNLPERYKK